MQKAYADVISANAAATVSADEPPRLGRHITIEEPNRPKGALGDAGKSIYVPSPKEREAGHPLVYQDDNAVIDEGELLHESSPQ